MLKEAVVSFFILCGMVYVFTYTSLYRGLKTDLMAYMKDRLAQEGMKMMMGGGGMDPLAMMGGMLGGISMSTPQTVTVLEANVIGAHQDILHIRYKLDGKEWEIYQDFNRRMRSGDQKYYLITNGGDRKIVHHHPSTPFTISASRLGVESIRVISSQGEMDYEGIFTPS
jgi:hypothetical protein